MNNHRDLSRTWRAGAAFLAALAVLAWAAGGSRVVIAPAGAHQPSPPAEHQPAPPGAGHGDAASDDHAAEAEHSTLGALLWPIANFIILAGGLWWFLKEPVVVYLRERHETIRRDLVEAAALKAAASADIAALDQKLKALPDEIEALRKRGADEIAAEEARIAAQAQAERDRLLEQTRREIDVQLRLARRDLVEHAANLSVQLAAERLQQQMTPDDQARLVDRYLGQVKDRPA